MSRILQNETVEASVKRFGADVWYITGERCSNASVKFWSALIDEILFDYPRTEYVVINAVSEAVYSRKLLLPSAVVSDGSLEGLANNPGEALRQALNEISIFGLPSPVTIRLVAGAETLLDRDLPLDCVDSEIMPFLVAWLFEWGEMPVREWNDPSSKGRFVAFDRVRGFCYKVFFIFDKTDISEGLYSFDLRLQFERLKQK